MCIAVLHCIVTIIVWSSIMSVTHTPKWVWNYFVLQRTVPSISVDKRYLCRSDVI